MRNSILLLMILILFTGCFDGCGNNSDVPGKGGTTNKGVQKTETGLKYKFHHSTNGKKAKEGDFLTLNMEYRTPKDSVIYSSFGKENPLDFRFSKNLFRGAINSGLALMTKEDSASFYVVADSLYGSRLPPFLKTGDELKYTVKMLNIQTQDEYNKAQQQKRTAREQEQMRSIREYLKSNNIKAQKTKSGVFYNISKNGTGEKPKLNDAVTIHYTGKLLNGTKFDSSRDKDRPFQFTLGTGQVIRGWDDVIPMFNKGASGKIIIPSDLAYGERQRPNIPGNSVLVFDIELVDITSKQ